MTVYAVVGLGYVGLGLAIALSKKASVYGYDIDEHRISSLKQCIDKNGLVSTQELEQSKIQLTHDLDDIKHANFYIVCVSTPAYHYEIPDLAPLISSVKNLAQIIKRGDTIVFESTVYPGTTEDICIPILEENSHLKCGQALRAREAESRGA